LTKYIDEKREFSEAKSKVLNRDSSSLFQALSEWQIV